MRSRPETSSVQVVLGNLTGVAAVVVGLLYIAGILVTSAELWHAGASIRDTLPLFALDHLLSRGVSLILPSLGVLVVISVISAGLWVWEERVRRGTRPFINEEEPGVGEADHDPHWKTKFTGEVDRGDWSGVLKRLGATIRRRRAKGDSERASELSRLRWRVRWLSFAHQVLLVSLLMVIPFFVPPVFSAACVVIVIAWSVWLLTGEGARPVTAFVAMSYAILLIATLANPWLHPRQLPKASVSTSSGGPVVGDLVLIDDGRWYVAQGNSLHIVEPARIESSEITYQERRKLLFEIIADAG